MIKGHPRFVAGAKGDLFVMEFVPEIRAIGTVLFFPAFGEEMNRARKMVSHQAKTMARIGYHVIIPDYYGTGDSAGEFLDSRWNSWKADMEVIASECNVDQKTPVWFWGLRLGALMTMDTGLQNAMRPAGIIAWSPVLAGKQYVNQLLRMRVMANMLAGSEVSETIAGLRASLESGESVEVGGYELVSTLINDIESLAFEDMLSEISVEIPIHWCEVISEPGVQPSPAITKTAEKYGRQIEFHSAVGPDFWATAETSMSEELIAKTIDILQ